MSVPLPQNEKERLRVLRQYGILDTPAEQAFDRITSIAARTLEVPIALVSLIDSERQFIKSCFGMKLKQTPREDAFCAYTILSDTEPMIVEDAREDPRFAENPLVIGDPEIRFYAGIPIIGQGGSAIGSLCILDREPRQIGHRDLKTLRDLASIVEHEMQLHLQKYEARQAREDLQNLYESVSVALEELRGNLLRTISHELRTPLNGIVGLAEILDDGFEDYSQEEIAEILSDLKASGRRMERTIMNICELTHLDVLGVDEHVREETLSDDPFEIRLIAEDLACSVSAQFDRESDLQLELSKCQVVAPRHYLSKALSEIIDNAFKFSVAGTSVIIRGELISGEYTMMIIDEGRGMSAAQLKQVGSFMQFDRHKHEQQGLGLGLELASKIAREFGLSLQLESEPGRGTRVTFKIPSATSAGLGEARTTFAP